jgi:hypothetical protein
MVNEPSNPLPLPALTKLPNNRVTEMNTEPEEGDDDLAEEEPIGPVKRIRPKRNKQKPKRLNGYQLY